MQGHQTKNKDKIHDEPGLQLLLLFLTFRVLVANPRELLYTVANPARGLLDREKIRGNDTTGCTQVILRHYRVLLFIQLE